MRLLGHRLPAKARDRRKAEWKRPRRPAAAGPPTLEPGSPEFSNNRPSKASPTSDPQRSLLPLLGGLGRPRSPAGREGAPLGEVSNRSQQTALLPRPGSWKPQAQPQSEGAGDLLGGRGEGGGGAWPVSQPAVRGSVCRPWALGGPKGERAARHALFSRRGWKGLVLNPTVSLCFPHRVQGACRKHRFGLRWQSCLPAGPGRPSGHSTCRDTSPDPQRRSRLSAGDCAGTASVLRERVSFQPCPQFPTPIMVTSLDY